MKKILFASALLLGFLLMSTPAQALTTKDFLSVIGNLQKELSSLKQSMGATAMVSPYSTSPTVGATSPNTLTPVNPLSTATTTVQPSTDLIYGMTNNTAVKTLQANLKILGYTTVTADGNFGVATFTAIQAFQKAKGLSVTGYVDSATNTAILSAVKAKTAVSALGTAGSTATNTTVTTPTTGGTLGTVINANPSEWSNIKALNLPQCEQGAVIKRGCTFSTKEGKACVVLLKGDSSGYDVICESGISYPWKGGSTYSSTSVTQSMGGVTSTTGTTSTTATKAPTTTNVSSTTAPTSTTVQTSTPATGGTTAPNVPGNPNTTVTRVCNSTTTPWLQVLSPNGGETYTEGQQITVKWTSCNVLSTSNVKLAIQDLSGALSGFPVTLFATTPNDGQESINFPAGYGRSFKIQISGVTATTSPSPADVSDSVFSIIQSIPSPTSLITTPYFGSCTKLMEREDTGRRDAVCNLLISIENKSKNNIWIASPSSSWEAAGPSDTIHIELADGRIIGSSLISIGTDAGCGPAGNCATTGEKYLAPGEKRFFSITSQALFLSDTPNPTNIRYRLTAVPYKENSWNTNNILLSPLSQPWISSWLPL